MELRPFPFLGPNEFSHAIHELSGAVGVALERIQDIDHECVRFQELHVRKLGKIAIVFEERIGFSLRVVEILKRIWPASIVHDWR